MLQKVFIIVVIVIIVGYCCCCYYYYWWWWKFLSGKNLSTNSVYNIKFVGYTDIPLYSLGICFSNEYEYKLICIQLKKDSKLHMMLQCGLDAEKLCKAYEYAP
jgi:hypothetical protein